jgi:hypothetical protein
MVQDHQYINKIKMSFYRIKIEEKNNGEKAYIPQVCKLKINRRLFRQTQELVWYNIHIAYETTFGLSTTITAKYGTEEAALKVIEDYKKRHQIEEDNKVKSTTYKMIE